MNILNQYDAIVVGGGAAGLMAAGVCAGRSRKTLLLEKNERLGRKLRITGKGRCNVTNHCSAQEVVQNTPRGGKFLYGALSNFPPEETMRFFEERGVPLKTERGKRVFPVSDQAEDIVGALKGFILEKGVQVLRAPALSVLVQQGKVSGVNTPQGAFQTESVLLACGGASYPGTGSNGDGYRLAQALGHHISPLAPSLVPLVEEGELCAKAMGLSLRNCGVKVTKAGQKKPVYEDFGELLFTHFGLSGPTILSASAHLHPMEAGKYTVHIDLKPALNPQQLDSRLLRDLEEHKNKFFANSLEELLPQKLIPLVVERSGIPPGLRCHSLTREQRHELGRLLKDFTVKVKGFRPLAEAIVTSGGVSLKEVNPHTMGSKLINGLYFAGEILDVDAYTGGYNLQIAFSTGRLAGEHL